MLIYSAVLRAYLFAEVGEHEGEETEDDEAEEQTIEEDENSGGGGSACLVLCHLVEEVVLQLAQCWGF